MGGEEVDLTPKEFDLLALLGEDPGAVVPRMVILDEVWGPHWYGPTKTVDVHVASLRRKLGHPDWVETVRRVGLRLGDTSGAARPPEGSELRAAGTAVALTQGPMAKRLLLSYLALALVVLMGLEAPLAVLAAGHERSALLTQAEREATGLAVVAAEDIEHHGAAEVSAIALLYRARTGGEVTVISATGSVMASSAEATVRDARADRGTMVGGALKGQATTAIISDEGRLVAAAAVPVLVEGRPHGAVLLDLPAGSTQSRVHEIRLALGLFGAGVLGLATLVGVLLARSVSRPLAHLELAVDQLGNGDLEARASTTEGPDEVRSLGLQFNRMAGRLSELMEAQSRFVADASHQLRSPLTALRLRLENLEPALDPPLADRVAAASLEVQRLSRLVDGMLALTRAGTDQPQRQPVHVGTVIAERCSAWSALAAERQVALREGNRRGTGPLPCLSRETSTRLSTTSWPMLWTLAPPGSQVRVEFGPGGAEIWELHVVDNGPGLGPEARERAFERFWQGPDRRTTDNSGGGGAGLGLAIVRQLAARNEVEVELRQAPEHGLDVVVRFQVLRPTDRPVPSSVPSLSTDRQDEVASVHQGHRMYPTGGPRGADRRRPARRGAS